MSLRLIAETRRLERSRQSVGIELVDASRLLEKIMRGWPTDVEAHAESIVVSERSATLNVSVGSHASVQRLVESLSNIQDLDVAQPRLRAIDDRVQATISVTGAS